MLPHYHVRIHLTRRGILVVLQSKQYVSPSLSSYPVLAPGPVHSALTHYQARPGQHIHFVGIKMMIFSLSVHQSISRSRQNLTFEAEISSGKYRGNPSTTKIFEKVIFLQISSHVNNQFLNLLRIFQNESFCFYEEVALLISSRKSFQWRFVFAHVFIFRVSGDNVFTRYVHNNVVTTCFELQSEALEIFQLLQSEPMFMSSPIFASNSCFNICHTAISISMLHLQSKLTRKQANPNTSPTPFPTILLDVVANVQVLNFSSMSPCDQLLTKMLLEEKEEEVISSANVSINHPTSPSNNFSYCQLRQFQVWL